MPMGIDTEQCLSILARWMLNAEAAGLSWGVRLPSFRLEPDMGKGQLAAGLRALAFYGNADEMTKNGTR